MRVSQSFQPLRNLKILVLDARSITSKSLNYDDLFPLAQFRSHWAVWYEQQYQDTNDDCKKTKE